MGNYIFMEERRKKSCPCVNVKPSKRDLKYSDLYCNAPNISQPELPQNINTSLVKTMEETYPGVNTPDIYTYFLETPWTGKSEVYYNWNCRSHPTYAPEATKWRQGLDSEQFHERNVEYELVNPLMIFDNRKRVGEDVYKKCN